MLTSLPVNHDSVLLHMSTYINNFVHYIKLYITCRIPDRAFAVGNLVVRMLEEEHTVVVVSLSITIIFIIHN